MTGLSERILNLGESATIAMSQHSRDLKAKGIDVINLSLGEPDFNTPDFIKDAAKKAIDENYSFYPPVAGYLDVREAICRKLKQDNNLDYKASQIVVSTGAKQSIMNAVLCLVNPGDEVIIPAPFWVSYKEMVKYAEGDVFEINTGVETSFKITPEQLENSITDKTRLFIFSSPSNPTGSAYSEDELRALAEVFARHPHVKVISDEIYEHIRYTGTHFSLASIPQIHNQVLTVNGVSKAFAMTGWRIGYLAANEDIAKACTKIQGQFTSAPSGISQRAAMAAIEADPTEVSYMLKAFKTRRQLMIDGLSTIPGFVCNEPEGAFYLFPKVSAVFGKHHNGQTINDATDLAMYLLSEAHVATVAGDAFGAPEYLRLSYATSNELLSEAIVRIKSAIENLAS